MSKQDILLETGTNELEIIEFYVREQHGDDVSTHYFGVNVAKVVEVVEAPDGLKGSEAAAHPSFLGTIPLRDLILPVVDLSVWLEMDKPEEENEPIIVTEFNNTVTGFLVSGVTMIHRINWKNVQPPSHYVKNFASNCITGTIEIGDHITLMLDLELALSELDAGNTMDDSEITVADQQYRALIADDSTSVRNVLRQNFEQANFDATIVGDGQEAWDKLQAIKTQAEREGKSPLDYLDVVVSDVEMPQMDGYTLTRKIKEDSTLKVLPVCLFSSLISKGIMHKGESVKADDQVTKPEFNALTGRVIDLVKDWDPAKATKV